ncbi:MAG: endonuclease/exonuclease/phosphatase family protein [Bacteroidota bacterium]
MSRYIYLKHFFILIIVLLSGSVYAQFSLITWNIRDFGQSKSESEMDSIVKIVRHYDIIAIQEVVAGPGGPQAVARLADALNRTGFKWQYEISQPTTGSSSSRERYAFLWKPSRVTAIGRAWLDSTHAVQIDREPFMQEFKAGSLRFTLVNFHAISPSRQPETEIKYFRNFPALYKGHNLVFLGDFNLTQSHTVFNPLKSFGYEPVLKGQKTSLKTACENKNCLSGEYDNVFYPKTIMKPAKQGVVHFYTTYADLKQARYVSDHIPLWINMVPITKGK